MVNNFISDLLFFLYMLFFKSVIVYICYFLDLLFLIYVIFLFVIWSYEFVLLGKKMNWRVFRLPIFEDVKIFSKISWLVEEEEDMKFFSVQDLWRKEGIFKDFWLSWRSQRRYALVCKLLGFWSLKIWTNLQRFMGKIKKFFNV